MQIVDSQQHELGPRRAWDSAEERTRGGVLTEILLAWMDAVGVAATLVFPQDENWAESAVAECPQRLACVIKITDPDAPDIEERVERYRIAPGTVALRVAFGKLPNDPNAERGVTAFRLGTFDRLFAACDRAGLPMFCSAHGVTHLVGEIARSFPRLRLIVDHLGIAQPPLSPREPAPWKTFPELLKLGAFENVAVKLSGLPVLSDERYPYDDVWPHVRSLVEAFGAGRIMWASDIAKFAGRIGWENKYPAAAGEYPGRHSYAEALFSIRHTDQLTADEKGLILGGTVRNYIGWPN